MAVFPPSGRMLLTVAVLIGCSAVTPTPLTAFEMTQCQNAPKTTAAERWSTIVKAKFRNRPRAMTDPGLRYWSRVEGRPNVLIYGDSISISYSDAVITALDGKANVIRLPENGSHSGEIIKKVRGMQSQMTDPALADPWAFRWDVIHFNAGLHDFKYVKDGKLDKVNGKIVNSVDQYKANLRAAIAYFRKMAPGVQLVFATTTPVPEGEDGRFPTDAVTYNAAAIEVMRDERVAINDLYAFTLPHLDQWIVSKGNVHFKGKAAALQGREVARAIEAQLGARQRAD